MDPNFAIAHYELGQAFEQKNMHNEAIKEFQKAIQLSGDNEIFNANLAYAYAVSGQQSNFPEIMRYLPPISLMLTPLQEGGKKR